MQNRAVNDDIDISGIDNDESTCIEMMLTECNPPNLDDDILSCPRGGEVENTNLQEDSMPAAAGSHPQSSENMISDNLHLKDSIGEFSVEGESSSDVWQMVSQNILHACRMAFKQKGVLQFCCDHDVYGNTFKARGSIDSLSKFSYSAGPVNIPHVFQSIKEFDAASEMLVRWVQQDRFGLDLEFVQELLEQLPEVNMCSEYRFLGKRNQDSILQTVGSGFLLATRKGDGRVGNSWNGLARSYKGPRYQYIEDSERKGSRPVGKPFKSKLPAYLIGDVLQVG